MANIKIDFDKKIGVFKPENCVNNGPIVGRGDQTRGNDKLYTAAKFPYARNHDASFCADYGGPHTVDVGYLFPDFSRDPDDESAYDFCHTDIIMKQLYDTNTKCFYRLGAAIEHWPKKYNIVVPENFLKWAKICEHIIRHYTEGWADGFCYDIEYWEIWNEADLDSDDAENKRCWTGTAEQFYEFYKVVATHLKGKFPHLKIGGPALAWQYGEWTDNFLARLTEGGEKTPLDFFSCHWYGVNPCDIAKRGNLLREKLDKVGYTDSEIILDEWNYVKDWGDGFLYSIEQIIGIKGAAFVMACMTEAQNSPIDMLMYYDARPTVFNGIFDFYTMRALKGYYPFIAFLDLYDGKTQVSAEADSDNIYVLAGTDGEKETVIITYYTDNDDAEPMTVTPEMAGCTSGKFDMLLLDANHSLEAVGEFDVASPAITMKANTVVMLKSK